MPFNIYAVTIDKCGDYLFRGRVIKNPDDLGYLFQINANTKSEYRFNIPVESEHKLALYVDEYTEISATISNKLTTTKGVFSSISKIKKIPLDPIRLNSKTIKLIKEKKCE
jgi:hypothetical protein